MPVQAYDGDFQATIARCNEEREKGIIPEVKPIAANLADYDTIFIGYPVWFGTMAPPMGAFLSQADLAGKKIVPFCTFGSGGLDSSVKDLAEKQPKAEILPGYGVGRRILRPEEGRSTSEEGVGTLLLSDIEHEDGGAGNCQQAWCRYGRDCSRETL